MPFSAIEVLTKDEAEKLTSAITSSIRMLKFFLIVCFIALLILVFFDTILAAENHLSAKGKIPFSNYFTYTPAFLAAILSYVFLRALSVIDRDVEIAELQAEVLLKGRNQAEAKREAERLAVSRESFEQPKGYGKKI